MVVTAIQRGIALPLAAATEAMLAAVKETAREVIPGVLQVVALMLAAVEAAKAAIAEMTVAGMQAALTAMIGCRGKQVTAMAIPAVTGVLMIAATAVLKAAAASEAVLASTKAAEAMAGLVTGLEAILATADVLMTVMTAVLTAALPIEVAAKGIPAATAVLITAVTAVLMAALPIFCEVVLVFTKILVVAAARVIFSEVPGASVQTETLALSNFPEVPTVSTSTVPVLVARLSEVTPLATGPFIQSQVTATLALSEHISEVRGVSTPTVPVLVDSLSEVAILVAAPVKFLVIIKSEEVMDLGSYLALCREVVASTTFLLQQLMGHH